ncbi:AAA family ATPase (plasmid) [Mesorhizobium sp. ORM8.1]
MELLHFGSFRLDRAGYNLDALDAKGERQRISMRPKAFEVLGYLVEHPGRIISQEEFLAALWPEIHVQPEVLKGHILAVRTALGDRTESPQYIETVRGRGYRFLADVQAEAPEGAEDDRSPDILVGRDAARAELDLALRRARSGEMQLVFLSGEAGIGKSSLTQAFAAAASQDGATVVTANCTAGTGETDVYYPILEILGGLCRTSARGHLASVLRNMAPTWLVQLPSLAPGNLADLHKEITGATPHRMARELCNALEILGRDRLLLLVFEDIHWADQATLDLIQALANRRLRTQLLILTSLRSPSPNEAGYAAGALAQRCSLYRLAREIKLPRLEEKDVATFLNRLAHQAAPAALTHHLFARSEGNPLFLRAMLERLLNRNLVSFDGGGWRLHAEFEPLSAQMPPDLLQFIESDINGLSLEAQNVLEAASLSDGTFSPRVHHVASALDERSFEAVCEALARRGQFIRRDDIIEMPDGQLTQSYVFRHALFQEATYDRQGPIRRNSRHAAIAARLEGIFTDDLALAASNIARHFLQAQLWPRAIHYLRIAARTAMQRFAMREAGALLELAANLSRKLPPGERESVEIVLLDELTRVYLGAFDKRILPTYERVHQLAIHQGLVHIEVRSLLGIGYVNATVNSDRSLEIMSQALIRSAMIPDPVQRERARCSAHGWRNWILGGSEPDTLGFQRAISELGSMGAPLAYAASQFDEGLITLPAARYAEAIETVSRNLAILADHVLEPEVDLGFPLWTSRLGIPWGLMSLGRFGEALSKSEAACAAIEANGDIVRSVTLRLYRAFMHQQMHNYNEALAMLDGAVAMIRDNGLDFPTNEIKVEAVVRGLACLGLNQTEQAFYHLRRARADMEARNTLTSWYWRLVGEWGLTDAHLAVGDLDGAEACSGAFLERSFGMQERTWRAFAAEACARVQIERDRSDAAQSYLDKAWIEIEGFDAPLVRWRLYAVGAHLADRAGDPPAAARLRANQALELQQLAHSLPENHRGRETLRAAQPMIRGLTNP